ncbi:MAG: hypothetical protein MK212_18435 [Saprospiraceae bacterium]|nr:hypothetical protein [Saprospiraceae bacterium]
MLSIHSNFKKIICCCLAILCTTLVGAQDMTKDFSEVYTHYLEMDYYVLDMKAITYHSTQDKGTVEASSKLAKRGKWAYSSAEGQKILQKDDVLLMVDEKEKEIRYQKMQGEYPVMNTEQYQEVLKQLEKYPNKFLGKKGNVSSYRIDIEHYAFDRIEIKLDVVQKTLLEVTYYYRQDLELDEPLPYKVSTFYTLNDKEKPSSTWFNTEKYIKINQGKAELTSAYKHYELIQ